MSDSKNTAPIFAKKAFTDGRIGIGIRLKCSGWQSDSARIDASAELTVAQARALAASLIAMADQSDAREAGKAAKKASREKWRQREIAAGRMVVMA